MAGMLLPLGANRWPSPTYRKRCSMQKTNGVRPIHHQRQEAALRT
jgi:hypothetical protein